MISSDSRNSVQRSSIAFLSKQNEPEPLKGLPTANRHRSGLNRSSTMTSCPGELMFPCEEEAREGSFLNNFRSASRLPGRLLQLDASVLNSLPAINRYGSPPLSIQGIWSFQIIREDLGSLSAKACLDAHNSALSFAPHLVGRRMEVAVAANQIHRYRVADGQSPRTAISSCRQSTLVLRLRTCDTQYCSRLAFS